jgi:hypothetical protein
MLLIACVGQYRHNAPAQGLGPKSGREQTPYLTFDADDFWMGRDQERPVPKAKDQLEFRHCMPTGTLVYRNLKTGRLHFFTRDQKEVGEHLLK